MHIKLCQSHFSMVTHPTQLLFAWVNLTTTWVELITQLFCLIHTPPSERVLLHYSYTKTVASITMEKATTTQDYHVHNREGKCEALTYSTEWMNEWICLFGHIRKMVEDVQSPCRISPSSFTTDHKLYRDWLPFWGVLWTGQSVYLTYWKGQSSFSHIPFSPFGHSKSQTRGISIILIWLHYTKCS